MTNNRYEFKVNEDKTVCEVYLKRPAGKYVGKVIKANNGHSLQEFAPNVMWLPVNSALAALGIRSDEAEAQTMGELGY